MNEVLSIRNLVVKFHTYEGIVQALNNIDLDIYQQETLGLVGETGCGKTMTALSILRLIQLPGKIEEGDIYFYIEGDNPINLLKINESQMREIRGAYISMVFQEPGAALNPVFTIGDQITEAILLHKRRLLAENALKATEELLASNGSVKSAIFKPFRRLERGIYYKISQDPKDRLPLILDRIPFCHRLLWRIQNEADKMALSLLKDVEIPDPQRILNRYPHELSGGMKQRAVIAMALACSPKLLIADEPTTSLDVTIQAQILQLLYKLKTEFGSSILYITHDLAVAAEICDRIGVMYAGRICEIASTEDIFTHPLHPYTRALMYAVPKPGTEPHPIGGSIPDPISPPEGCRFHPRCSIAEDICKKEVPKLREIAPAHFVACHLAKGESSGNTD